MEALYVIGPELTEGCYAYESEDPQCTIYSVETARLERLKDLPDPGDIASKSNGDRIHANPYVREVVEVMPVLGTFNTFNTFYDKTDLPTEKYCSGRPHVRRQWSGDIGYFASFRPLYTVPAANPDTLAFLVGMSQTSANADLRRSLVNAPMLVAERRETITYFVSKAKQLSAIVKGRQSRDLQRYFKSRKADRGRVAKDIANEHLGLLFGLLPLIDEIRGAARMYEQDQVIVMTGRGRRAKVEQTETDISARPSNWADMTSGWCVSYNATDVQYRRISARTSISVEVVVAAAQKLRDLGFNPLATTYDLVPLSFLTEFISNLGTFIRALDPLVGVRFRTGNTTVWDEWKQTLALEGATDAASDGPYSGFISTSGEATGFVRRLVVTRTVLTDFPDNELFFANNLTVAKAITVGALAIQRYLKPVKSLIRLRPFRYKGSRPKYLPPINYR